MFESAVDFLEMVYLCILMFVKKRNPQLVQHDVLETAQ